MPKYEVSVSTIVEVDAIDEEDAVRQAVGEITDMDCEVQLIEDDEDEEEDEEESEADA